MGKSVTINVIGFSKEEPLADGAVRRYECHAMTKTEMVQKKKDMAERGSPIVGWYAQTNAGCKMLGKDIFTHEEVKDSDVKHTKLITCPVCNGKGKVVKNGFADPYCMVCNGSGITKSGHWNKWQEWQLNAVRAEFRSII